MNISAVYFTHLIAFFPLDLKVKHYILHLLVENKKEKKKKQADGLFAKSRFNCDNHAKLDCLLNS